MYFIISLTRQNTVFVFRKLVYITIVLRHMSCLVTVPPKPPKIIDETGRLVAPGTAVGPYMEGDTVVLKCIVLEGKYRNDMNSTLGICKEIKIHSPVNLLLFLILGDPTPMVTWWRDSHLVDSSFEGTYKQTMQNTLSIPNISKQDLLAELTCSASNNNITMPSKTSVVIEMKCMYQYERKLAMIQIDILNDKNHVISNNKNM